MSSHTEEVTPSKKGTGPLIVIGVVFFIVSIAMQSMYDFNKLRESSPILTLFDINIPVIVGTIGLVLILWGVIKSFYTTPLWTVINERNHAIEHTFSEAESLKAEMTQLRADYEAKLAKTEADARAQIQAQIKEAQDTRKQLIADAAAKADDMKKAAEAEIEGQKKQILGQLRVHVATLSLQASEKILKENVDNAKNRAIIDDFLSSIEVKN